MTKKNSLLCLLYHFPPSPGTASIRNHNHAVELSKQFDQCIILSTADASKAPVLPKNTSLHSISTFDYRSIFNSGKNKSGFKEEIKFNYFSQFIIRLINTFPINLIIGEGGGYYLIKSYFTAKKLIREKRVSHLYSSYRPLTDHYVAYLLKKKYKDLIWIADFRDLIIDPHYRHQFFPSYHRSVYKRIFSHANILTTVSKGLAEKLKDYHTNVISLKNGINNGYIIPAQSKSDKFNLVYTGAMFLDERNAEPIFKALTNLIQSGKVAIEKIGIIYAGKDQGQWNKLACFYKMENVLVCPGEIDHQSAVELQNKACINILLTIASPQLDGVLTGKLIEYLQAASPILAIVKNQNDAQINDLLKDMNVGISVSDQIIDLELTEEFILKYYNDWLKSGFNSKPLNAELFIKQYERSTIFQQLLQLI